MIPTLKDAIYGLAVGDAFGVPYEFMGRNSFAVKTEMISGGVHNQPAGTWSDDTSMTLATCDSFRLLRKVDVADIRGKFNEWARSGKYAIDGVVFDIGSTVATALSEGHGCDGVHSNGNGSLMRIIPLSFYDVTDDEIKVVSAITHAHSISTDACVKFVHIARELIEGKDVKEVIGEYEPQILTLKQADIKSGGYVLDTYTAALWCLVTNSSYKDTILAAVQLGGDTDTTAAVAGALAGIVYGYDDIPASWVKALRGKDLIDACI